MKLDRLGRLLRPARQSRKLFGWLLLSSVLVGCGVERISMESSPPALASATPGAEVLLPSHQVSLPSAAATPTALPSALEPSAQATPTAAAGTTAGQEFYSVDTLVRSDQLDGIDMHVRYVERAGDDLIVHLSFYNNRGEDLAYVSGASVSSSRLSDGNDEFEPEDYSDTLSGGIDPGGGWYDGGANVGSITFAGVSGDELTLAFPGFPDVDIALDDPIDAPPPNPAPEPGTYIFDVEAGSDRLENIALRVDQAVVDEDGIDLTISFLNRNDSDITFSAALSGDDGVLFDGNWQQYRPASIDPQLESGIAPEGVWGQDEAHTGTLRFPLPASGDVMLFKFPSYPLIRLPLRAGEQAALAAEADLPPSTQPRPTPTPAPTPTPLSGEDLARQEINTFFSSLNAAVAERNRDAYVNAFAPELRDAQGAIFDRIPALPIDNITIAPADEEDNGSFANENEVSNFKVEYSYNVRDVDPANTFASIGDYTLAKQDGAWSIRAVEGGLPFWAYGPTEAKRAGPFWIFYRPEMAGELPAIEAEAQRSFDAVNQALPGRAQPVNVMHVTATEDEFYDLTDRIASRFLGVATARYQIQKAGIDISSQAFYINGAAFEQDAEQNREQTIAHEFVHLVLSPQTMPYTPAWISEGAATYFTDDFRPDLIKTWLADGGADEISLRELSSKTSFGEHDFTGEQTEIDYAYSANLARYIVDTYGKDKYIELYDSFATVPFERIRDELPSFGFGSIFDSVFGDVAQELAPEQIQQVLGVDIDTLERDYEAWLAQQP